MIQEPVVILTNGNFPIHPIPLGILNDAQTIVCCDGAVNKLAEKGMEPTHILGDMDSISVKMKTKYHDKLIELTNQDKNDLRKAIKWSEEKGIKKSTILGATGKRDDHSLANIFTLLQYPTQIEMKLYTDYGIFSIVHGQQEFDSFAGEQVSIFSTDPSIEITSKYLKYNLNNKNLTNLYYGSLNESLCNTFTLRVSHGKIIVYQVFA